MRQLVQKFVKTTDEQLYADATTAETGAETEITW
jgi:hypothetical protein